MTNIVTPKELEALLNGLEPHVSGEGGCGGQPLMTDGGASRPGDLVSFDLRALCPESQAPCVILLKKPRDADGAPLLDPALLPGRTITDAWLKAQAARGVTGAYVFPNDLAALQNYFRRQMLASPTCGPLEQDQRCRLSYEHAVCILKSALRSSGDQEALRKAFGEAVELVGRLMSDDALLRGALLTMGGQDQLCEHGVNVCLLGLSLAKFLGWTRSDAQNLALALMFHDLGMSSVPRRILSKPARLDADEMRQVRRHTRVGTDVLACLPEVDPEMIGTIRNHHENLDGSGYPQGLDARRLGRNARVARIADTFDAITSRRPWRGAMEPALALKYMREEMGSALDQGLVTCFFAALEERPASKRRPAADPT